MKSYRIAVIAGDGIGKEVIPAGIEVVEKAAAGEVGLEFVEFPWGCDFYLRNGRMMAPDGLDQLQEFDAIYLGTPHAARSYIPGGVNLPSCASQPPSA